MGRLISDVTLVSPGASPLVHDVTRPPAVPTPAVRPAITGSVAAAIAAPLAIVLLLGLGAGRELGWRRRGHS